MHLVNGNSGDLGKGTGQESQQFVPLPACTDSSITDILKLH
jgi:hypothetical protein